MSDGRTALLGLDWCTTSLRAYRIDSHGTVLEERAGLFDFQLEQQGPHELTLSTAEHGAETTRVLHRARDTLAAFLHEQGASEVLIHCHTGRKPHRGRSGKLQRVIASPGR